MRGRGTSSPKHIDALAGHNENGIGNSLGIRLDVFVPVPQHVEMPFAQPSITRGVIVRTFFVGGAVEFDNQPCCMAVEVRDEGPARVLAAERQTFHSSVAKRDPEFAFGARHVLAQLTGAEIGLVRGDKFVALWAG